MGRGAPNFCWAGRVPVAGRRNLCNPGLGSPSMVDRRRWRFDFLLRRRDLRSRRLGRRGTSNAGLRSRSLLDLWWRRQSNTQAHGKRLLCSWRPSQEPDSWLTKLFCPSAKDFNQSNGWEGKLVHPARSPFYVGFGTGLIVIGGPVAFVERQHPTVAVGNICVDAVQQP